MSISYNPSIPQSNDLISNSQPQILQNFGAINTIVGIDHYSFASSAPPAGDHKQVTFGASNPASPDPPGQVTVNPPVLFTNIKDGAGNALPNGVAEMFFYSGTPAQGQNNYVAKPTGSTVLMGGIIMKWGHGNVPPNVTTPVSFTQGAFPNNCFTVVVSGAVNGNLTIGFNVQAISPGSFDLRANGGGGDFYYIAIGN